MHFFNKKRQCICCLKDLDQSSNLYHLFYQPTVCTICLNEFDVIEKQYKIMHYPILILYDYNAFFQKQLYQFKGQYDLALAPLFLELYKDEIKNRYNDHVIVVLPSSEEDDNKRGFNSNVSIVSIYNLKIFKGLYKKERYKQTDSIDRSVIKKVLSIQDGHRLSNKKVLLFDDVVTSGNTLMAAIELIKVFNPVSIEILVLASKLETRNKLKDL